MVNVKEIPNRSTSATCGVFEREVVLKNRNVAKRKPTKRKKTPKRKPVKRWRI